MTGPADGGGGGDRAASLPALDYPLDYTFKIMGLAGDGFAEHVRALVARVVGEVPEERVRVRESAGGRYLSVSVVARLESEDQRREVYLSLRSDARVVYYL